MAGLSDDVAASVLGQRERQVEDQAALGVFPGGDLELAADLLLEHLHGRTAAGLRVVARRRTGFLAEVWLSVVVCCLLAIVFGLPASVLRRPGFVVPVFLRVVGG
jgi:hypothetical protein